MTKFFWFNNQSIPVEFTCESKNCPYVLRFNERCRQCLNLKAKLDAVDFLKIISKVNSKKV